MGWVIGDRVGVMIGADADTKIIKWLGFGRYIGETIPSPEAGGFNFGVPNPTLELDSGKICYGCETWWGAEGEMKVKLEAWVARGWTIMDVDIDDERRAAATS